MLLTVEDSLKIHNK